MATDKKISDLTENPSIDGTEEVATEKGGSNFKNTYTALKTWITSTFLTDGNGTTANGSSVDLGGVMDVDTTLLRQGTTRTSSIIFDDRDLTLNAENTSTGDLGEMFISPNELVLETFDGVSVFKSISLSIDNIIIVNQYGKGISFNDYTVDNANVGAWGTAPNAIRSEAEIIANTEPKANPQVAVSSTPQAITTSFSSTTQNVYGVGALCVYNVTTGCLNVGEKFAVNVGDADGVSFVGGGGTNLFGVITGSTTIGDTVMIERITDSSFGLTGEVYKVM